MAAGLALLLREKTPTLEIVVDSQSTLDGAL